MKRYRVLIPGVSGAVGWRLAEHLVHLVQGSKYYGSELGPHKTPAKESDPRILAN